MASVMCLSFRLEDCAWWGHFQRLFDSLAIILLRSMAMRVTSTHIYSLFKAECSVFG